MAVSSWRVVVALAIAALVSGCSVTDPVGSEASDSPAATAAPGSDELVVAMRLLPATLDPAEELSASYLRSLGASESLLKVQADGSVAPELAAGIEEVSPTVWEVRLRDDVQFWSGAPVDADAVVASIERSRRLSPLAGGLLDGVDLEAVDPRTVRVTTEGTAPDLPFALSHYMFGIHNVEQYGEEAGAVDVATADLTGPFHVTEFATGRQLVLERFDGWWGELPTIRRIVAKEVGDAEARAQLAITGQADIVQDVPTDRSEAVGAADGTTLVTAPAANTVTVYLNPASDRSPALSDQRVREALAWGLDREEIVTLATHGLSVPASSWLASSPAYPQAAQQGFVRKDLGRAEELLDEAGWVRTEGDGLRQRDGEPLRIRLLTFGNEQRTGEVLQAQWARLGVDVEVSNVEGTLIKQAVDEGDWDAVTQAWTTLGATAELLAAQIAPDGAANHGRYDLPGVADLLEQGRTADDAAKRTEAIYALNQLLVEHVPSIPVHPRVQATAVADRINGFVPHPLQYENLVQPSMSLR